MPEADQWLYMDSVELEPITLHAIRNLRELKRQPDAVRESGFAFVREEYKTGIVGLAVPVLSPSGAALESINVDVPSVRFDVAAQYKILKVLTADLSRIQRNLAALVSRSGRVS